MARLKITMKNGRTYISCRLKKYTIHASGGDISRISWEASRIKGKGVLIATLDLTQIEAIEVM